MDLSYNELGENAENFKWLAEGMKQLTNNLPYLELDFSNNGLGDDTENIK